MERRVPLADRKVFPMHYFALLLSPEPTSAPDPEAQAAEMVGVSGVPCQGRVGDPRRRRADARRRSARGSPADPMRRR